MTARVARPLRLPVLAAALALSLPLPAQAQPTTARDRAQLFATCEGRFWAMAARQRAIRAEAALATEAQRQAFFALLEAVLPDAEDGGLETGQAKRWQATGWTEVAYLLADTVYVKDEGRAALAETQLGARLRACSAALLPGD